MEEFVVNAGCRAGSKSKQRACAEKRGKKREEEVKTKFSCAAKKVIG
jgi:hypothetical protein